MTTITDLLANFLGTYDFSVRWDIPYIFAGCLLLLGTWFCFKVILALIYFLGGKR